MQRLRIPSSDAGGPEDGDIDGSGVVDFPDFVSLSANFGNTIEAVSVPEPAALPAAMIVLVCSLLLRKRGQCRCQQSSSQTS